MKPWFAWGMCAGILFPLAGCRSRAADECAALVDAKQYEAAVVRCETAFASTRDARAGMGAARALQGLGRDDDLLRWEERLRGSAEEAAFLSLSASIHRRRGERTLAQRDTERQLELHRAAGRHADAAKSSYRLYYLAWEASDFRLAIERARESSAAAAVAGDREGQATALEGVFAVLMEIGDLEGARRSLEDAAALGATADPARAARLLFNEGRLRLREERPALARNAFERALASAPPAEGRRFFRSAHLNVVEAALLLGDLDAAERHLKEAWAQAEPDGSLQTALLAYRGRLEHARGRYGAAAESFASALAQKPDRDWAWQLEHEAGLALERLGRRREAEAAYRRAIGVVEEMRAALGFDDLKTWLLDRKREPYEALFRLQAGAGRSLDALDTLERAKARSFLDAFVRGTAVESSAGAPEPGADRAAALQELLPAMSESPVAAPRSMAAVLQAVSRDHVLLYLAAGEQVWLATVAGGTAALARLPATATTLRQQVDQQLARPDDVEAASRLASVLLPPRALPAVGTHIHVVTDGALGRLSFAALRRNGRWLAQDYAITYAPSLTAMSVIRERTPAAGGPPVVLGDPRGDLPGAAAEARAVAAALGVAPHVGPSATMERLRVSSGAALVHLATHSGLGPRGAWVTLADGTASAHEILRARVGPRLVVLASCASGARRDKGMWGALASAFLAAGSEGVLASLWSVDDEAARRFVLRFYQEGGAIDAATALARAQRSLIAEGAPPSAWAPFVLLGLDRRGAGPGPSAVVRR